jgi:monovalent cation:H+ antiporter-2, CPA2 family
MLEEGWGRELLIFLGTAGIVVPLVGRLRFGVVPGFLIAGVVLGPGGLGHLAVDLPWLRWITFSDPERVRPFAELGVVFLLFLIGLEFSLDRLWAMRRYVLGVGAIQMVVSAAAIMAGTLVLGVEPSLALVIGLALSLSSTAIVSQVLLDARRFGRPVGRVSLGVLLFQDLMVVPIVIVVELLGGGEIAASGAVLQAVGIAIAAVAGILVAGRYLIRPLLRIAAGTGNRDLVIAIALFLAIGTAVVTAAAGLSPALGAFLAGLLLGESEYRHQLEVDVEPFKGLLLGLFFMTVGMSIDVVALLADPLAHVAAVVALVAVKAVVVFAAARVMRVGYPVSIEAAFLLRLHHRVAPRPARRQRSAVPDYRGRTVDVRNPCARGSRAEGRGRGQGASRCRAPRRAGGRVRRARRPRRHRRVRPRRADGGAAPRCRGHLLRRPRSRRRALRP